MNMKRNFAFVAVTAMMAVVLPCIAQESQKSQATTDLSGTGDAGHIAVWKNSTTLASSMMTQVSGNIGIGTTAPAAKLEVDGNAQVDGDFSLSGSILLTGVGQLIWASNDGNYNFSAGLMALPSTTSGTSYNTAVGYGVLQHNTLGSYNTAIGALALQNNRKGAGNTAYGSNALQTNTDGSSNTAIGERALVSNTSSGYNTAIGAWAMYTNYTGESNTAIGANALEYNETGQDNFAGGENSLLNNLSGNNNIAVGYDAGFNITTSNNIHIGNQGSATDSGTIRVGCTNSDNCPFTGLPQTQTFIAGIYGSSTSLANVPVVVDSNGNLGTVSSSRRYKEDINDMGDASDGLMHLRPVTFKYRKTYEDGSKPVQYGLIAEEVAEVYPDLVARSADGQVESVRYQLLDPMLLNELQKQHATIDAQKEQIRSLEERLARVESMLAAGTTGATGQ
jgi:hypothetical protein